MKPPVGYFGGKTRMAPWIASQFTPHRVYLEPFCGSAAVLLAKDQSKHEIINDIDADVVTFFKALRDQPDELTRACELTPYARDEYEAFDRLDSDDAAKLDPIEQARRWWVRSTQSFGQAAGVGFGWSLSVTQRTGRAAQLANRVDRFDQVAQRLRTVAIEHCDAVELLQRIDGPDVLAYVDPPYLWSTRSSYAAEDGAAMKRPRGDYAHEFSSDEDHRRLAAVLADYKGTVIVSGYPSDLYDQELYVGWHREERRVASNLSNGSDTRPDRTEVLWSNRPLGEPTLFAIA